MASPLEASAMLDKNQDLMEQVILVYGEDGSSQQFNLICTKSISENDLRKNITEQILPMARKLIKKITRVECIPVAQNCPTTLKKEI